MGFGLPSAIGAKVAAPAKIVVDIDGDASFSMTAMEMATAAQYGIGVKVRSCSRLSVLFSCSLTLHVARS